MKISRVSRTWGWWLSLVVVFTPVILWQLQTNLVSDLKAPLGWLAVGARFSAFVGLAGFAWSIIMSARLHWLERSFKGLDKLYIAHQIIGGFSLLLWFTHPLLLTIRRAVLSRDWLGSLDLWMPELSKPLFLNLGIAAVLTATAVTVFTYLIKLKHENWVRIHRFFGIILIPAGAHGLLAQGQAYINQPLRYYLMILCGLAVLAFLYHSVLGQLLVKRYRYRVQKVLDLGQGVVEITLKRLWRPIIFTPGQFAYVGFRDKDLTREAHPYSFTSSNRDGLVQFVVKNLGDYTAKLPLLDIGSDTYLEGPFGGFTAKNSKFKKQIWIAGGIGITPFLSMARSLSKRDKRLIELYYCTKTPEEAVFEKELKAIARKYPNFKLRSIYESKQGFLTADKVAKISGNHLNMRDIYICGPPVMMQMLSGQFKDMGVPENQIHNEDFAFK